MDVTALQKMLAEDTSSSRIPLIVIADAGTPITGHIDNLARLQELCRAHDVWLHIRGHSLAALSLPLGQHNGHVSIRVLVFYANFGGSKFLATNFFLQLQSPPIADSFTLPLGSWFGVPGLPMVVSLT